MHVIKVKDHPEKAEKAILWFHQKWKYPLIAYQKSIQASFTSAIPAWYIIENDHNEIIAGAGLIENDFHDRKDLHPNICAIWVEESYRRQGIAKQLLQHICKDASSMGLAHLYLVTSHTSFYEQCGWSFLTMVKDADGSALRMYTIEIKK
ncbi:GNAT family N-acetyltransferase [Amedibacillus sp. YH-ame10]